jgi:hypothetical protein
VPDSADLVFVTKSPLLLEVLLSLVLPSRAAMAVPPAREPVVASNPGGDAELSVAVRAETSAVRTEVAGFVGLSMPLERLVASRRIVVAAADPAAPLPAAPPPAATDVPPPEPASERETAGVLRPLSASSLSTLARGALAAARRAEKTPERERALDGLATRARVSALLPEVRVRAARTRDETLRLAPTADDPYRVSLAGGDAVVLEGSATFRLSRLVFADEELAVERLRLEWERAGERRNARVLERVLAWHAALVRLSAAADETEGARFALELEAAAVELDVLTNGWFGARPEVLGVSSARGRAAPEAPSPGEPRGGGERGEPRSPPRLVAHCLSAKPPEPCLPMHEMGSRTFKGASMR